MTPPGVSLTCVGVSEARSPGKENQDDVSVDSVMAEADPSRTCRRARRLGTRGRAAAVTQAWRLVQASPFLGRSAFCSGQAFT